MDTRRTIDPAAAGLGLGASVAPWIVGIPFPLGAALGAVTFAVASPELIRRLLASRGLASETVVPAVEEAARPSKDPWVRTGERAIRAIDRSVASLGEGPLRQRLSPIAGEAHVLLGDLRSVARQAASLRAAEHGLDTTRLSADITRLANELDRDADPAVEEDLRRSLAAVQEQLKIHARLEATRKERQAKVESVALGLQHMAAQISEMTALVDPDGSTHHRERLEQLTSHLEGLRAGLQDASAVSRRALGTTEIEGGAT